MDIRPAAAADLPAMTAVWYATEVHGVPHAPPAPETMPWLAHVLTVGRAMVAEEATAAGRRVVGFGAVIDYGSAVALSDLFVDPARQSDGVGAALLDALLPPGRPLLTMASADPRAVASYARRGLRPRWPAYYLAVDAARVRPGRWPAVDVEPLPPGDFPWALPGERDYYLGLGGRTLAVRRAGEAIGSALVQDRSPERLHGRESAQVVTSRSSAELDAPTVVLAVVEHLLEMGAHAVLLQVPGPHPVLPELLDRGWRITDVDIACATDALLLPDPHRHTLHGEAEPGRP